MCGIVGYTGHNIASEIIIDSLKKLEYRGYDSAGLTLHGKKLITTKTVSYTHLTLPTICSV